MKRSILFLICALLLLNVGCASKNPAASTSGDLSQTESDSATIAGDAEDADQTTSGETRSVEEQIALVQSLIDAPIEDLYTAIDYPNDSAYASSCLGDGEDGELYYDGFTVYTYRDVDGSEVVYDVMPAAGGS